MAQMQNWTSGIQVPGKADLGQDPGVTCPLPRPGWAPILSGNCILGTRHAPCWQLCSTGRLTHPPQAPGM